MLGVFDTAILWYHGCVVEMERFKTGVNIPSSARIGPVAVVQPRHTLLAAIPVLVCVLPVWKLTLLLSVDKEWEFESRANQMRTVSKPRSIIVISTSFGIRKGHYSSGCTG
jgi:hypothetical protein